MVSTSAGRSTVVGPVPSVSLTADVALRLMYASEMLRGSLLTGAREDVARGTVSGLDQMSEEGTRRSVLLATASGRVSVGRADQTRTRRGVTPINTPLPLMIGNPCDHSRSTTSALSKATQLTLINPLSSSTSYLDSSSVPLIRPAANRS